jgi:hypothetical protein
MSRKWDLYCRDCNVTHGFEERRTPDLIRALIRIAPSIAALAPARRALDAQDPNFNVEITTPAGRISPAWFETHAGHRLAPRDDDGGEIEGTCAKRLDCKECGSSWHHCVLAVGHEGDCALKEPKPTPTCWGVWAEHRQTEKCHWHRNWQTTETNAKRIASALNQFASERMDSLGWTYEACLYDPNRVEK